MLDLHYTDLDDGRAALLTADGVEVAAAPTRRQLREAVEDLLASIPTTGDDLTEMAREVWDYFVGAATTYLNQTADERDDEDATDRIVANFHALDFRIDEWDDGYFPTEPRILSQSGDPIVDACDYIEHLEYATVPWIDHLRRLSGDSFGRWWSYELTNPYADPAGD